MLSEALERRCLLAAINGVILSDINPGAASALSNGLNESVSFKGRTYFAATDAVHGTELFATDGTAAGTTLVTDLTPGDASSHPRDFVVSSGKLYFIADWTRSNLAESAQAKVFVSDGTAAGTHVVENERPYDNNPSNDLYGRIPESNTGPTLVAYDGKIAFVAAGAKSSGQVDNTSTQLLWLTDGTAAGTGFRLILGASAESQITHLTPAGANLFFNIGSGGTPAGYDAVGYYSGIDPFATSPPAPIYGFETVQEIVVDGSSAYVRTRGRDVTWGGLFHFDPAGIVTVGYGPFLGVSDIVSTSGHVVVSGVTDITNDGSQIQTLFEATTPGGFIQYQPLATYVVPSGQPAGLTAVGRFVYFVENAGGGYPGGVSVGRYDTMSGQRLDLPAPTATNGSTGIESISGGSDVEPAFVPGPDGAVYFQGLHDNNAAGREQRLYRISTGNTPILTQYAVGADGLSLDLRPSGFMTIDSDWYAPGSTQSEGREWRLIQQPQGHVSGQLFEAGPPGGATYPLDASAGVVPYLDTNNNERLDAAEPTATFAYGGYEFSHLLAGQYVLRLAVPTGTQFINPDTNAGVPISISEDGNNWVPPFFLRVSKTLTAKLFKDVNGNNFRDAGEPSLPGRRVFIDSNTNGVLDAGETSLLTDTGGVASFRVYDGAYVVRQVLPAGWESTNFNYAAVNVTAGATLTVPLGSRPVQIFASAVAGNLFNDINANRIPDAGETPLPGRTVFDDINGNGLLDVDEPYVISDAAGAYVLFTPEPGTHTVRQLLPTGWEQTSPAAGTGYTVEINGQVTLTGRDFGSRATPDPAGLLLEGEAAAFTGGTVAASTNSGFTGTGYADFAGFNSSAEWSFTRRDPSAVALTFRYANGSLTGRPLAIYLNGVDVSTLPCTPTGSWTSWKTITIFAGVVPGLNTLRVVANTSNGGANLDSVRVATMPPPWLSASPGAQWALSPDTLTIFTGTVTVLSDVSESFPGLSVDVRPGGRVVFNSTQHLGTFTVAGGAAMASGRFLLRVGAMFLANGATLDLNDSDLMLESTEATPGAAVPMWIISARAGGTWTGPGLGSTAAYADKAMTLASIDAAGLVALNGPTATFHGEAFGPTAVFVKSTFAGDATFDGVVNFNDFLALQNHFGQFNATFAGGDFDYDFQTDFNDFLLLQNNFGRALPAVMPGPKPSPQPPATASLTGRTFNDNNKNAKYDTGDGIGRGVVVFLDTDNDGVLDSGEKSVTTDANGKFAFTGLAAGTYRVRRVFAAGQTYSTPLANLTLTAGQAKTGVLVGTKKV